MYLILLFQGKSENAPSFTICDQALAERGHKLGQLCQAASCRAERGQCHCDSCGWQAGREVPTDRIPVNSMS